MCISFSKNSKIYFCFLHFTFNLYLFIILYVPKQASLFIFRVDNFFFFFF